jgi:hypothetical protein
MVCGMLDFGTVPEWLDAVGTIATAVIAFIALRSWRGQLQGSSKHAVAVEALEQARLLRYVFYDARNVRQDPWEFPHVYLTRTNPTNDEKAEAYTQLYRARWRLIEPQIEVLTRLRARVGALLGDDVAAAMEKLIRTARELERYFNLHIMQINPGEKVTVQLRDQATVERIRSSVSAPDNHSDSYSVEFEAAFSNLQALLKHYV